MAFFPSPLRIWFAAVLTVAAVVCVKAQSVVEAVNTFDQLIRNYNLITFGDASFKQYGDTEGPIAVRGNLYLDGGSIAAHPHKFGVTNDPTLYVGGQLTMRNTVNLESGFASLPNLTGNWTWDATQKRLVGGGGTLSTSNTSHPLGAANPRNNPGPQNWDWNSLELSLIAVSQTLLNAPATGQISVVNNTLRFSAPTDQTSGVVVYTLDMNLLSGNKYNGQSFSNIGIDVPENMNFIINVINAGGRTLFGTGNGINFNNGTGYERLLWNIAPTNGEVFLGNGGQFYGSVLAPTIDLNNKSNTAVTGQIVARSYDHSGAELHYIGFDSAVVPEPSTYGLILLGAGGTVLGLVRHLRRRKEPANPPR